jgi:hypothetical protein
MGSTWREMRLHLTTTPQVINTGPAQETGPGLLALVELVATRTHALRHPAPERQQLVVVIDEPSGGTLDAPFIAARALTGRTQRAERLAGVIVPRPHRTALFRRHRDACR